MASVINDPNGRRRIEFADADGSRKTVRLGKCDRRTAEAIARHVEHLLASKLSGQPVPRETATWLASVGGKLKQRLARVGLVEAEPTCPTLGEFLAAYLERRRADLQPSTLAILKQAATSLVRYFGERRRLDGITPADALDWERWLGTQARTRYRTGGLSVATVRKRVRVAKTIFNEAVEREVLARNPFARLKGATPASVRREFIPAETIAKAIEYCPDAQWRLILALARWGGLRIPSELLALTWDCVDWERQRLRVPSPKTARAGKPYRIIPIFPEIRPHLEAVFEQAEPGVPWVITRYRDSGVNLRTRLLRILAKAGIEPWPQLFQSLRKTRATELARTFPQHVATAWLGHTKEIAERNYWTVTDADFERATKAPQNPTEHLQESSGTVVNGGTGRLSEMPCFPDGSATCYSVHNRTLGCEGLEPPTLSAGKPQVPTQRAVKSDVTGAALPGPLADALLAHWHNLPYEVRQVLLDLARAGS